MCLSSQYQAVIIRLIRIFSGVLEECVTKSDHRYVIDFQNMNSENTCYVLGMLLLVIIQKTVDLHFQYITMKNIQINNKLSAMCTQKSRVDNHAVTDTLSTFRPSLTDQRKE